MIIKTAASQVLLPTLVLCFVLTEAVQASTWDEIARLDANKSTGVSENKKPVSQLKNAPRWLALSNGQRVDLNNWKVVVFLNSTCIYCHKYNPLIKEMADTAGFSLLGYSLDGKGDVTFPYPMTPSPEVMSRFFGQHIPVATPTSFLVNVNTLTTFPLLQGDQLSLMHRLDEVFLLALQGGFADDPN